MRACFVKLEIAVSHAGSPGGVGSGKATTDVALDGS